MRRAPASLAAVAVLTLGLPSAAWSMAMTSVESDERIGWVLTDEATESNRVTVSFSGGRFVFQDTGAAIVFGVGGGPAQEVCVRLSANRMSCPPAELGAVVTLGALDDTATAVSGRVANLNGGAGNDLLTGNAFSQRISGGPGNDTLKGRAGNDGLYGDAGADLLSGSTGNDRLVGGSGVDRFFAYTGNDTVDAADGVAETVVCGPGVDVARVDRADRLSGCERVTRL